MHIYWKIISYVRIASSMMIVQEKFSHRKIHTVISVYTELVNHSENKHYFELITNVDVNVYLYNVIPHSLYGVNQIYIDLM